MTPEISVLLPVRDGEEHLRAAIDSIRAQTCTDWELIVIDDGSVDASAQIALSYGDPRIRLLRQSGQGISRALNHGLASATGVFLARMDADDLSAPTRLAQQARLLRDQPDVVCVGCSFEVLTEDGAHDSWRGVALDDAALRRTLRSQSVYCHGSVMVRRSSLVLVGGYRTEWEPAEDYDLWLRLAGVGRLAALPEALYRHRSNPHGVSAGAAARQQDAALTLSRQARLATAPPTLAEAGRWRSSTLPDLPQRPEITRAVIDAFRHGAVAATADAPLGPALLAWAAALTVEPGAAARLRVARRALRALVRRARDGGPAGGSGRSPHPGVP